MKVLKFGGTSVGSPLRISEVKKIVEQQPHGSIIVVSAFKGITDQLVELGTMASMHDATYTTMLSTLETRHSDVVKELISPKLQAEVNAKVGTLLSNLKDLLNGVFLIRNLPAATKDSILSYGEQLSSLIISYVIEGACLVDARKFIVTDANFGNARVDMKLSSQLIQEHLAKTGTYTIVPGFIGSTASGETTILGRGGSDYTAAIIAAALNAEILEIWTDVDGFMTADPRRVEKAFAVQQLTYSEAMELSHFGAKVVYTPTIKPVFEKNIPVLIKNSFNPSAQGTIISCHDDEDFLSPIKGISSIDEVALLTLQGAGMVGVTGTSMRLFGALARNKVNIILITQASSEYSISFAVSPSDKQKAIEAITVEFDTEINYRNELKLIVEEGLSIIAIVGEKMKNTPGISANLFNSLGRNGINVIATAQGSSELNISVVIKNDCLDRALNAIHEGFFLSKHKELHLFVVGIGNVGGSLLKQIHQQRDHLMKQHRLKLNLIGVSNSKKMLFKAGGIDIRSYKQQLDSEGEVLTHDGFVQKMANFNLRNSVFVDCTANASVASLYAGIMNRYISIVATNKIACSSDLSKYKELKNIAREKAVKFYFETTVGAGLPIINTINDLVRSGDTILKLEAVLSGTLNFIFNAISAEVPMSRTVELAKEKGYSEPDPRIDLSGNDVVNKILILSREAGYDIERKDVDIKTFLPAECFEGSLDDFWVKIKKYDASFEEQRKVLASENKKWRFVARLDKGKASVELITIESNHPAYHLEGSNNIVLITTERYKELPMVIKGYGAGPEVTAAGIFADIMRVANV